MQPACTESSERSGLRASLRGLVDLVLPPMCRLCDEPTALGELFCGGCNTALRLSNAKMQSACARCGRPGAISTADRAMAGIPGEAIEACNLCQKEKFTFDRVVAKWTYEGRVCDAIVAAKHAHQSPLGSALGRILADQLIASLQPTDTTSDWPDIATYVPASFWRRYMRGGRNGNVAIAEGVRKQLAANGKKIPVVRLLKTTRGIKKQALLTDTQRLENVRGAFVRKKSYAGLRSADVSDKHILLVDDVLTTGATANEVAKVLKEAGARRVTLAVVARAVWSSS